MANQAKTQKNPFLGPQKGSLDSFLYVNTIQKPPINTLWVVLFRPSWPSDVKRPKPLMFAKGFREHNHSVRSYPAPRPFCYRVAGGLDTATTGAF